MKAASVSKRRQEWAKKEAQKIILEHLIILNGKSLWGTNFHLGRSHKKRSVTLKVVAIPSYELYQSLKKDLEQSQETEIVKMDGYSFIPTKEGALFFNDKKSQFFNKRFKSKHNFKGYLYRLCCLYVLRDEYERYLKHIEEEKMKNSYEGIKKRSELRLIKKPVTIGDISIRMTNLQQIKNLEPRIKNLEQKFVKKFWRGDYQNYKKFKQRARADGLI